MIRLNIPCIRAVVSSASSKALSLGLSRSITLPPPSSHSKSTGKEEIHKSHKDKDKEKEKKSRGKRKKWPIVAFGLGCFVAGGVAAFELDDGLKRTAVFWVNVIPIYSHYRYVQWLNQHGFLDDVAVMVEYDRLHNLYSDRVRDLTLRLRGFYIKHAQLMSTRDDFVPKQYLQWLKLTQDEVSTEFKPGQVRSIVEAALKKPIHEVFEHWEEEPHGVASIGQVHRARLRGGREVVVKVQFPDIEQRFRSDIKTTKQFCQLAMPHHVPVFNEIEKQFLTEFDYRGEAQNLMEIQRNITPVWGHRVKIPSPVMELCTKDVLVMDYLPGEKLIDGIRRVYRQLAMRQGKTLEVLEEEQKEKLRKGELAMRTPAQERWRTRLLVASIRAQDLFYNALRFFCNWSPVRLAVGRLQYEWSAVPIQLVDIIDLVLRVHAHEIFHDGAFNGDPHPGNILLMPDGRLGLIDYGQVKHLALRDRIVYAKLILALARDDKEEVARVAFDEMGVITKYRKPEVAYRQAAFWNDRDTDDITHGMNIQEFMDWAQGEDPLLQANDEHVMAGRVSVMMRALGNAFGIKMRTAPVFAPYAKALLESQGIKY